ncbi:hypothetical protein BP5796_01481 [Coleophoma crateriformis]|uniref:TOG domain-containing protein n=1 Tax=Coleophoma crateriformis TaxID=565419 RepID=A0A3D8T0I5_9HELO|nr:hypothetical protein BP5796_01481 [Coleophoma crateriformis]
MGEKITEEQVANLLAIIRTDASVDAKVNQINTIKSGIKQHNVPDPSVPVLFEALRIAMTAQQAALVNAGFSTLNHLLTRLSRQEPKYITKEAARTLPLVVEKMGDHKDKFRQVAAQCLTTIWSAAPMDTERAVKNTGMVSKSSRGKEACMKWIVQMHQEYGLQFKAFVPTFMELLEDADGMVRDNAKNAVIDLFQNAPNAAKSDLKKQLKITGVRPSIATTITNAIAPGVGQSAVEQEETEDPIIRPTFTKSVSALSSARPATPVMEVKIEHVDPAYVNTQRELEDIFRDMHPFFEGRESEANWLKREQSCTKLRKLNAGNAPSDFPEAFLVGIKGLLDGILKAVNSLRTSLSKEGCSVVQEIARNVGPGLDPMVEILLQNLIKLCGGTKKISSAQGNATVDIIISKVSYNHRILQHIWFACEDKNVQPRTYATGWLKTLLKKEVHHKNHIEHTGGLDTIEKCIKKGLADANPGVRESMRSTYWVFAGIWPMRAEAILATLEPTQAKLLENHSGNPNPPKKAEKAAARPGLGFSKSTTAPPKPSLRETMLAQKRAAMASKNNLPARPGSAMSSFSPVRSVSTADAVPKKTRPDSVMASHGGLSVAPMRPTKMRSRPEITRPATAGPYSVRRPVNAVNNGDSNTSPTSTKTQRARAPSAAAASPPKRGSIPRPATSHSSHPTNSNPSSPAKSSVSRVAASPRAASPRIGSPRASAARPKASALLLGSSPTKGDEEFTMVVPTLTGLKETYTEPAEPEETEEASEVAPELSLEQPIEEPIEEPETVASSPKPLQVYEDPFSSTDNPTTPKSTFSAPVLEEVAVNEDVAKIVRAGPDGETRKIVEMTPEKYKQNSRLLDSGISKVKAKSLDVHGFRKLQSLIRDNKATWTDEKFDALLLGLFEYLESPLTSLTPEKVQDVKAQILATIKLMYRKDRGSFRTHVPVALESLLVTRSCYDARAHIVSGLELLSDDLITLAEPKETIIAITSRLQKEEMTVEGSRILSMGLHVLKSLIESSKNFAPGDEEVVELCKLASRCLESSESGVRMDAVQLCVALHAQVGETPFWTNLEGVKDDPKSLITYYIVKRQREVAASA